MPAPRNLSFTVLALALALTAAGVAQAAPPASAPAAAPSAAAAADYGGRDSAPMAAAGDAAPNPAAQAGRALEALVVVLAGVVGAVSVLKRFDLVRPGGVMLHVVRAGGKNLLLAATAQSVTTVAEWSAAEPDAAGREDEPEDYLTPADPKIPGIASGIAASNARLRSLLSSSQPEEPS